MSSRRGYRSEFVSVCMRAHTHTHTGRWRDVGKKKEVGIVLLKKMPKKNI